MRLLLLRKQKYVLLFLVLVTTVSVLWTYWIGNRAHRELEGLQLTKNSKLVSLTQTNLPKANSLRTNRVFSQENELDVRQNDLSHTFTGKSKAGNDVTDKGLLQRLQELEKKTSDRQSQIVLIGNGVSLEDRYVKTITEAFNALGYKVALLRQFSEIPSSIKEVDGVWCLQRSKGVNASSGCFWKNPLNIQKMSPVPGSEKLLLRNDGFCYLISAAKEIPALQSQVSLSPPCFVLPAQWDLFLYNIEKERSQSFTLKSRGSDVTPVHQWGALDTKRMEGPLEAVLQLHPVDVLLIKGKAFIMQVYVLVTSVSPARVYRHREGHILFAHKGQEALNKWNLTTFVETHFGAEKTNHAIECMDDLIVKLLLILEPSLLTYFTSLSAGTQVFRCKGCFQPLQFSFAFSPTLDPFILEVKAVAFEEVSPGVIEDTVNLLFNSSSVLFSHDIYQTLEVLGKSLLVKDRQCENLNGKCLTDDLLEYLLETKQEELHKGEFKRLYPTSDDFKFKALIPYLWDTGVELHYKLRNDVRTSDVHDILTAFVAQTSSSSTAGLSNPRLSEDSVKKAMCNNDPDADPVLMELRTQPAVVLTPTFSRNVLTYQTTVSFDTMVLQIWGRSSLCRSVVRINSKYEDNQASNHSLGVGWNKFSLYLIDTRQSNPVKVVNTYDVFVFRKRRSETENPFDTDSPHQVCVHHQECSLRVFPSIPCGLEKLSEATWGIFVQKRSELPVCKTGHESGHWVLPCVSCDDSNSCYWREAVWTPHACRYSVLTRDDVRKCLANKKILFVGDSTNRGIMYYLMEKLNGSLRKWEMTHTMKIYSDELNGGHTSVSFAYYPQFWLPVNMRPVFVKSLYQLIARFLPLENNSNTILVVGGVQWMDASHIAATNRALISLGLNGIKVVVKSLGSGFHLPVPGLPRHDLAGQRWTAERNQQVISAANRLDYQVVDTFGMTASRYKDFLMGNCGCHFHKVVDMRSLRKEEDEVPSPLLDNMEKSTEPLPRYHVIGPINSVYSEVVINRICN